MKRLSFVFAILIAATLLFDAAGAGDAFARGPGGGMKGFGPGGGKHLERLMEELDLTDDQRLKLDGNREAQMVLGQKLFKEFAEKQKELGEELESETTNRSKINALAADLKEIQGRMIDLRIDSVLAVKEILTPEQYKKFSEGVKTMRGKRHDKRKDRKEKRKKDKKKDKDKSDD